MGLKHHVNNRVLAHSQFYFVSEFKNLSIVYVLTNQTNHTNRSSEKKLECLEHINLLLNKRTVTCSFSSMLFKISTLLFLYQSLFPNTVHSLVSLCELKALYKSVSRSGASAYNGSGPQTQLQPNKSDEISRISETQPY